jgi:hypothetical protein
MLTTYSKALFPVYCWFKYLKRKVSSSILINAYFVVVCYARVNESETDDVLRLESTRR